MTISYPSNKILIPKFEFLIIDKILLQATKIMC